MSHSEPHEETVDPLYSVALSSKSVPMVSVKQTMTKLLGAPYHRYDYRMTHYIDDIIINDAYLVNVWTAAKN